MSRPSFTFYADSPVEVPAFALPPRKSIIDFVKARLEAKDLDYRSLARLLSPRNPSKAIRALESFSLSGDLPAGYEKEVARFLDFPASEFARFEDEWLAQCYLERELFISRFSVFERNSSLIESLPELSNIRFPGLGFSFSMASRSRPLCLGELLHHYGAGQLLTTCTHCPAKVHILSFSGSPLSGSNSFYGFCPDCGERAEGSLEDFGKLFHPVMQYESPFPFTESPCTIGTLLERLLES